MKKFVTLFERTNNEILLKDVGMIPYFLTKQNIYDASVATCKMEKKYEYLDTYLKGFHIDFFPFRFNSYWLSGIIYLLFYAKKIDILNIYHLKLKSYGYFLVYKMLNRKGKVYLKLDIDYTAIKKKDSCWKKKIYKYFLHNVDYCSAESTAVIKLLKGKYNIDISYIPNGFFEFEEKISIPKEKIFLTVGRLGTKQKATDILLNAFKQSAKEHNWNLELVGGVDKSFEKFIKKYYLDNPDMNERVFFRGKIEDKKELRKYYERAMVFLLPSRWESFGLVLLEAMNAGCFLVGTDQIPPMEDLICNGKYGQIIVSNSEIALKNAIINITEMNIDYAAIEEERNYVNSRFRWDYIVKGIARGIEK